MCMGEKANFARCSINDGVYVTVGVFISRERTHPVGADCVYSRICTDGGAIRNDGGRDLGRRPKVYATVF